MTGAACPPQNPRKAVTFEGALIREQGVEFAIVIVKRHVIQNRLEADRTAASFRPHFGVPVVLMAQDGRGVPTYYGRNDLVRFLANTPMEAIPWTRFSLT